MSFKNKFRAFINKCELPLFLVGVIIIGLMLIWLVPWVIKEYIKKETWIGFFGGYLGGVFGGLITLIVLFVTLRQTDKIQKESTDLTRTIQDENRKIQLLQDKKEFTNDIAVSISKYVTDINKYFYAQYFKYSKEDEDRYKKYRDNKDNVFAPDDEKKYKQRLQQDAVYLLKYDESTQINREQAVEMYFLLKIKLADVESAKKLLRELHDVHNRHCFIDDGKDRWQRKENFEIHSEHLLKLTNEFISDYVKI